jgi:hypothetical protein
MGFFFSLLFFGVLVAFNMFAVDTMMRMRSDIQIIRKSLSGHNAGIGSSSSSSSAGKLPKDEPTKPQETNKPPQDKKPPAKQ